MEKKLFILTTHDPKKTGKILALLQIVICAFFIKGNAQNFPTHYGKSIGEMKEQLVSLYADSINEIATTKVIPDFLSDRCLDYNPGFWKDVHHPTSLRYMILKKVNNLKSLHILLCLQDRQMQLKCNLKYQMIPYIPYVKFSFYQLISKRYTELWNDKEAKRRDSQ